jgi:hypothetical protein
MSNTLPQKRGGGPAILLRGARDVRGCTKLDEETVIQPHNNFGKRRGWRVVFVLAHLWFMLANAYGLVGAAMNRRGATSPLWGFSESRIRTIQLVSTLEVIGRLGYIAVGIHLLGLFTRRDERAARYYVR